MIFKGLLPPKTNMTMEKQPFELVIFQQYVSFRGGGIYNVIGFDDVILDS